MKGISEKTLIKIKDLKASVKLNNGDMLTTVTNANLELQRGLVLPEPDFPTMA